LTKKESYGKIMAP